MGIHVISACDPLTDWISGCFLRLITADARLEILRMAHCLHVKLFVNYHKKTYIECVIATFKAVTFAAILASRCTLHNRSEENN